MTKRKRTNNNLHHITPKT